MTWEFVAQILSIFGGICFFIGMLIVLLETYGE